MEKHSKILETGEESVVEKEQVPVEVNQVVLSAEQEEALKYVCHGKNVFITGSAGVGKSFLLKEILKALKDKNVYVTASTGVAACNIGGTTLHSFSGIGLGDKHVKEIVYQILYKNYRAEVLHRWESCDALVIDEISMIDGEIFSKVEQIARLVRNDPRPFGGIQLILCGDFLQLPPVNVKSFAFETAAWRSVIHETIVLKKVFRQKLVGFVALLNRMRYGQLKAIDIEVLHECSKTVFPDDGIKATRLFPFRAACDQLNIRELSKLPSQARMFRATDWARDQTFRDQLEKNCKYPKVLELKIGAQVMLLTNLNVHQGLVNGARGVVVAFKNKEKEIQEEMEATIKSMDDSNESEKLAYVEFLKSISKQESREDGFPVVRFANGVEYCIKTDQINIELNKRTVAHRLQLPLNLAWAVSVHKAQGMTLERVDINIAKAFEHGQAYVALSRVTSLKGLLLRDFNPAKITAHPKVLKYYNEINPSSHQWADIGEEELKEFIGFRRDPIRYKKEIEAEENIAKERILNLEKEKLEETISVLEESRKNAVVMVDHNYATPTRPIPQPLISRPQFTFQDQGLISTSSPFIDLTTPTRSNSLQGISSLADGSNTSIVCGEFDTPISGVHANNTSTPLPQIYSNALSEAEQRLQRCKDLLKSIKINIDQKHTAPAGTTKNENHKAETLQSAVSISTVTDTSPCKPAIQTEKDIQTPAACALDTSTPNVTNVSTPGSSVTDLSTYGDDNSRLVLNEKGKVTIVVESDDEDFINAPVNLLDDNSPKKNTPQSIEVHEKKPRRSLRKRKRKSYDDFIVEDISNENSGRKGKSRKNNSSSSVINVDSSKDENILCESLNNKTQNNMSNTRNIEHVDSIEKQNLTQNISGTDYKKLLEEKREEIEKKRMQALAKRLNSLKRQSVASPFVSFVK